VRQARHESLVSFGNVKGKETPREGDLLTSLYKLEVEFSESGSGSSEPPKLDEDETDGLPGTEVIQ
jgi:hypothetical protein